VEEEGKEINVADEYSWLLSPTLVEHATLEEKVQVARSTGTN